MGTGGSRRGRRDNGLTATEYAVVGDVDPRVGEHLLDVLAAGGIAAYLQPASDLHPITRTTTMPSRPTDRLFVDRAHLDTARGYLTEVSDPSAAGPSAGHAGGAAGDPAGVPAGGGRAGGPAGAGRGENDEAWAGIVARLEADLDPVTSTWPDPTGSGRAPADPTAPGPAVSGPTPTLNPTPSGTSSAWRGSGTDESSLLDGLDTFGAHLPDDEGSYQPPPPPPLPRMSKAAVLGTLAIIVGFVLFVWPAVAPFAADVARLFGFVLCAAGFTALIWRLRPGTDEDDEDPDPDNGAVV